MITQINVQTGVITYAGESSPSTADVDAERLRRIVIGKTFTIPGYGDIAMQGREEDQRNLLALANMALQAISAGQGSGTMQFRAADNVIHTLTWTQMLTLCNLTSAYVSAIYAASWALKDNPPIPGDYADAGYWL